MNNKMDMFIDSNGAENVISNFESSLSKIKDVFQKETTLVETINQTDVWTGDTQRVVYDKHKKLEENFKPIEEGLQVYINFLKKTVNDYLIHEATVERNAEENASNLTVNS